MRRLFNLRCWVLDSTVAARLSEAIFRYRYADVIQAEQARNPKEHS